MRVQAQARRRQSQAADHALRGIAQAVALDLEGSGERADRRAFHPLGKVELRNLGDAAPAHGGGDIHELGLDLCDRGRRSAGLDEQPVEVAGRMHNAGGASFVQRPGRASLERERLAREQRAARVRHGPARTTQVHALEINARVRKLGGPANILEKGFGARGRNDGEALDRGVVEHEREPARHERWRARRARRRVQRDLRLCDAHALGGDAAGENLERLVVCLEGGDANRGTRVLKLDGVDVQRADQPSARAFQADRHRPERLGERDRPPQPRFGGYQPGGREQHGEQHARERCEQPANPGPCLPSHLRTPA